MRKSAVVLLCIWFVVPALAAKRVTVDELKQAMKAARGMPDTKIAEQVSEMELSERLSRSELAQIQEESPGPATHEALIALADASAFLDPPTTEVVSKAAPSVEEQRAIMGLVAAYVSKTIPQLPNFIATRETTRYEDTPLIQKAAGFVPYQPMHRVGNDVETVTYRAGHEEIVGAATKKKQQVQTQGLTTWGVFGPILSTVLLDAAQSKLTWDHWEKGALGDVAVFAFNVPKDKSHYEVNYCCYLAAGDQRTGIVYPFRRIAGYRGKMAVDPETGTILRLMVDAELGATDPVVKAAILVEYGKVEIGGKPYVCPLRSVSKTRAEIVQTDPTYNYSLANQVQPLKNSQNDVTFSKYQVFRADATILY